jgi:S-adenosylmethionine:tRNA ribosyltransferase-isomerase
MATTLDAPAPLASTPARAQHTPFIPFAVDDDHEAHEPPEARGVARDEVRLMVSVGDDAPVHRRFTDLPDVLAAGDLLVVNTSATIPAAVDGVLPSGDPVVVHVSTPLPGDLWVVEVRTPVAGATQPRTLDGPTTVALLGGGTLALHTRFGDSRRLWVATADLPGDPGARHDLLAHLVAHGRPIRYRYVPADWPLAAYQTAFATEPGSAEMPSAARPFTPRVVTDLVRRGVTIAPLVLHTGVASLEGGESPYPERYRVPAPTAALANEVHARGGRVVAVGTTVVRALETVVDDRGVVHPGEGWTELVVTPERGVRSIDGLVTGWHEPVATHLLMLEAVAGRCALEQAYAAAWAEGYLWHEFGDSHLLLRDGPRHG